MILARYLKLGSTVPQLPLASTEQIGVRVAGAARKADNAAMNV